MGSMTLRWPWCLLDKSWSTKSDEKRYVNCKIMRYPRYMTLPVTEIINPGFFPQMLKLLVHTEMIISKEKKNIQNQQQSNVECTHVVNEWFIFSNVKQHVILSSTLMLYYIFFSHLIIPEQIITTIFGPTHHINASW